MCALQGSESKMPLAIFPTLLKLKLCSSKPGAIGSCPNTQTHAQGRTRVTLSAKKKKRTLKRALNARQSFSFSPFWVNAWLTF